MMADGRRLGCESEDFSMGGVGVRMLTPGIVQRGDVLTLELVSEDREFRFPVEAVVVRGAHVGLRLLPMPIETEANYVRCTFASPNAWADWDRDAQPDRPLASLAEVFSFGATGYLRLFESVHNALLAWYHNAPPRRTTVRE
jgi:cellulose synthase (UDP-forming)